MVVDGGVWVAYRIRADAHHERCEHWLNLNVVNGLAIPTLALVETAGAVSRRTGRTEDGHSAVEFLLGLPRLEIMPLDESLAREAADIAARQRLRGADAVYVATAARARRSLVTLDEELAARARDVVNVIRI